jgi:hypothetical protein
MMVWLRKDEKTPRELLFIIAGPQILRLRSIRGIKGRREMMTNRMLVLYYGCVIFSDEHFSRRYGFWRPYVEQVIYHYLDCGDLHNSFARLI